WRSARHREDHQEDRNDRRRLHHQDGASRQHRRLVNDEEDRLRLIVRDVKKAAPSGAAFALKRDEEAKGYAAFFSRSACHFPSAASPFIFARWAKARWPAATFSALPDHAFCGAACSARP